MASWRRAISYGLVVWLIPFVVAVSIGSIRQSWKSLFDSIMPVVLSAVVSFFALRYFRIVKTGGVREGALLGLLWLAISVLIDLPLMLGPPLHMPLAEYTADVGLTYVMMPIITIAIGAALAQPKQ